MKMLLYKNGDDTQKVFFFGDVPAPQTKLIAGKQYQKVDLSDDESGRLLGIERQRWYQQRPFEYIGPYVEPSPHNQPFMPCLLSDDDYKLICRWLPNVNPGHQPPRELHSLFLVQFQYPPEHCRQLTWAQIMEILRSKPLPVAGQAKPGDADKGELPAIVLDPDDLKILKVLAAKKTTQDQYDIEANTELSRRTVGERLARLRKAGYTYRPNGKRGGEAITNAGRQVIPPEHAAH